MSAPAIDHQAIGRSRVATQYWEAQKFLAYLRALLDAPVELESVLQTVARQTDIDVAEGVNLDVLGEIVGISRIVPFVLPVQLFGFDGQPGALPYGEEGNPSVGGRFREEIESGFDSSVLADPDYRILIKAKIIKNHSRGTNEDILAVLSLLFGPMRPMALTDSGGMAIQLAFGFPLGYLAKTLIADIDILPRPAGVRISQRVTYEPANFFGFGDQPGAWPFSEEGTPAAAGGQFAEEF